MSSGAFTAARQETRWPRPRLTGMARSARVWNAGSAFFLFATRVIAAIVQLRVVEKYFGGSFSGLTVVSNQVLVYVTLLELGMAQAAISFLYEPILNRDHVRASALVLALRSSVHRVVLIGSFAIFPALAIYAHFLHSQVPYSTTISALWLVAAGAFMQLGSVHFQAYLNAAERLGWVNLILGIGFLVKTAIGLLLALHLRRYLYLPATISVLTIAEFFSLKFAFSKQFADFRKTEWREAAATIRLRAGFALIHKVAGLAYYQSDFIVLSLTLGLTAVKDYAKYQYISAALLSIIGTVSIAVTSSFAYSLLSRTAEERFAVYSRLQLGASVLATMAFLGYFYAAPDVVRLAFGNGELIGRLPLTLFGLALFLNTVKFADDMVIVAKGAFRIGYGIPICEAPLYISLGVLLTRRFGFPGILVASIVTNLLISVFVKGLVLSREVFDSSRRRWFVGRAVNVALAALLISPLMGLHYLIDYSVSAGLARSAWWCGISLLYGLIILRKSDLAVAGRLAPIQTQEPVQ